MIELQDPDWLELFPRQVLVRGTRWRILAQTHKWKDAKRFHGLTDYAAKTLHVMVEQSPDEVLDTLLHELTHLVWSEYGLPKRPTEERVATAFGAGWAALFVQNPGLTRAIDALRAAVERPD